MLVGPAVSAALATKFEVATDLFLAVCMVALLMPQFWLITPEVDLSKDCLLDPGPVADRPKAIDLGIVELLGVFAAWAILFVNDAVLD